jgi:hypothetical protein
VDDRIYFGWSRVGAPPAARLHARVMTRVGDRPVTPEGAGLSFGLKMESRPVCQSPA